MNGENEKWTGNLSSHEINLNSTQTLRQVPGRAQDFSQAGQTLQQVPGRAQDFSHAGQKN